MPGGTRKGPLCQIATLRIEQEDVIRQFEVELMGVGNVLLDDHGSSIYQVLSGRLRAGQVPALRDQTVKSAQCNIFSR